MTTVTVLQNHSDFMERMWLASLDHYEALPLSLPTLDVLRRMLIVVNYRGQRMQLGAAAELIEKLNPGAEYDGMARAMAQAVEGEIDAWYCVADDDGAAWLEDNFCGPLMRWNGAAWWIKLKGLTLPEDLEVVFHESYRKPKKSSRPAPPPAGEAGWEAVADSPANNQSLRRGDVRPID